MKKKTQIGILGAFDRDNFGDLMFPLILQRELAEIIHNGHKLRYFGLVKSDLSDVGGVPTEPIASLLNPRKFPPKSIVIVAGGEVLNEAWKLLYYYIRGRSDTLFNLLCKNAKQSTINSYIKYRLGAKADLPFAIPANKSPNYFRVIYNAVGGACKADDELLYHKISSTIRDADYISVREKTTHDALTRQIKSSTKVHLDIDCVINTSRYFPRTELSKHTRPEITKKITELSNTNRGYLVFQCANSYETSRSNQIADQLCELAKANNLSVLLLPLGKASGHDDVIRAREIFEHMKDRCNCNLFTDNSVFETLQAISNSRLFIGTSLHGAIIALSYAIPHVSLGKNNLKVRSFLDTWDIPEQSSMADYSEVLKHATKALEISQSTTQSLQLRLLHHGDLRAQRLSNALNNILQYKTNNNGTIS